MSETPTRDWLALSFSFRQAGNSLKAIEFATKALTASPSSAEAHQELGAALLENGQVYAAQDAFDEAMKLNPLSADIQISRAWAMLLSGHKRLAVEAADAAIRLQPLSARAWTVRGVALRLRNEFKSSEEALRRALQLEPADLLALTQLGHLLLARSRVREAEAVSSQAFALDANSPQAQVLGAWLALRRGRISQAKELMAWASTRLAADRELIRLRIAIYARADLRLRPWLMLALLSSKHTFATYLFSLALLFATWFAAVVLLSEGKLLSAIGSTGLCCCWIAYLTWANARFEQLAARERSQVRFHPSF